MNEKAQNGPREPQPSPKPSESVKCGLVMPISAIDGCPETHWVDVRRILSEAIRDAGFEPNLVSAADDIGIIQKRIIQNLYENPIVVCDVSGKNPNVMFELGIRLAFDKPALIVKDDKTAYSFDTSPIEHLSYPRDLRFNQIVAFKDDLSRKLKATHTAATTDSNYTTFLKHFGTFSVAKLQSKEVSSEQFILEELSNMRAELISLSNRFVSLPVHVEPRVKPEALPDPVVDYIKVMVKRRNMGDKATIRAAKDLIIADVDRILSKTDYKPENFLQVANNVFDALYPP
jgi:hypothetical protein